MKNHKITNKQKCNKKVSKKKTENSNTDGIKDRLQIIFIDVTNFDLIVCTKKKLARMINYKLF